MQGMILGTFQYMAPEQVEGKEADARTDIWGFGCLLYEMLTGRRAFDAATQAALIAAILERQPQPIDLASSTIAPAVKRLVAACLEKDPAERFQTMRDIRRELEWLPGRVSSDAAAPSHASRWQVLAWRVALPVLLLIAVLIATLFATRRFATPAAAMPAVVLNVGLPWNDAMVSSPSVSPEGTRIAFIAQTGAGESIWIRRVDAMQAQPLKGTTGVRRGSMFWSPDGKSLGFFSSGKLRTIELATERVDVICDAPVGFGGTWGADGTILFSPDERSPIYRVSAQGGAPAPATVLDAGRHEHAHRWPQFLPDGRHFVFMVWNSGTTTRPIQIASLDGTPPRTLFEAQTAAFVAGDYLLFVNDHPARLMAWAFDAQTLQLRGKPFAAVPDDNVDYAWPSGDPMAAASTTGTLAYTTGQRRTSRLTWFSRTGRPLGTVGEPGVYYDPALSPDGSTMAVEKHDWERFSGDIWTVDLSRGAFSRLTTAPGFENVAIWSPDGRQIAFSSDQEKVQKIFVKNASGSGADQVLIAKESRSYATDWSSDGRHVLFMTDGGTTGLDVWSYDVEHRTSSPLLASPFSEALAKFSPDGKWIAYVSDEAQQRQVFVQSFPGGAVKIQISTAGGNEPEWRRDGKELFYLTTDGTLMAVGIQVAGGQIHVGTTEPLFVTNIEQFRGIRNEYTASSDGQRFLVVNPLVDRDASPIVAVLNWRGVPAR
jgi:Tol biopolymer transport system component